MSGESFRFIYASDFHLERPLGDLDAIPEHLRGILAAAPWKAAEAVFAAAIVENVDFVVLCGDLLHPGTAGARGVAFLLEQFAQLDERGIPVVWVAGHADDPERWPEAAALPESVHLLAKQSATEIPIRRNGETICTVVGRSSDGRQAIHAPSYRHDPTDLFTIAAGYGTADPSQLADTRFDYWALGGEHNHRALNGAARVGAAYCGTPQGRSLAEPGAHGFCMVDVDADGSVREHFVECDTVRYARVRLDAADLGSGGDIRTVLASRIQRLQNEHGTRHLLLDWQLHPGSGEAASAVGDPAALLSGLRRDFGHGTPGAWSVGVTVAPPEQFPQSWYDEDTILGDFLRSASAHRKSAGRDLALDPVIEEHPGLDPGAAALLAEIDPQQRTAALNLATLLGIELLRGGKPDLVASPTVRK